MANRTTRVVRKPIVTRTPIFLDEKFQTIASHSKTYEPCVVMNEYPDIATARLHYAEDIARIKREEGPYENYGIKRVTVNKEDN